MADLGILSTKKSPATAPVVVVTRPALGTPGRFAKSFKNRGPLPTWAALPVDALQLPVNGMIYGTLKIAGVAAPDRQLRCYDRTTGNKVIGCAISDQAGNYKFHGLTPGEKYYVVAVDFPVGGSYDAVIQDNVIAEIDQFAGAAAASASASGDLTKIP